MKKQIDNKVQLGAHWAAKCWVLGSFKTNTWFGHQGLFFTALSTIFHRIAVLDLAKFCKGAFGACVLVLLPVKRGFHLK